MVVENFIHTTTLFSGAKTKETGYDAFVDVSKALMRGKSAEEQQAAVAKVLRGLMPRHLPYIIRTFFKPNKLALQLNAMFTPPIFSWLVGPAEVSIVDLYLTDSEFTRQQLV